MNNGNNNGVLIKEKNENVNRLSDKEVEVSLRLTFKGCGGCPDVNSDGNVDIFDLVKIATKLFSGDITYDLNDDDKVRLGDIFCVARSFGERVNCREVKKMLTEGEQDDEMLSLKSTKIFALNEYEPDRTREIADIYSGTIYSPDPNNLGEKTVRSLVWFSSGAMLNQIMNREIVTAHLELDIEGINVDNSQIQAEDIGIYRSIKRFHGPTDLPTWNNWIGKREYYGTEPYDVSKNGDSFFVYGLGELIEEWIYNAGTNNGFLVKIFNEDELKYLKIDATLHISVIESNECTRIGGLCGNTCENGEIEASCGYYSNEKCCVEEQDPTEVKKLKTLSRNLRCSKCPDVNNDEVIDISDLTMVSTHLGETNENYNLDTSNDIVDEDDIDCVLASFNKDPIKNGCGHLRDTIVEGVGDYKLAVILVYPSNIDQDELPGLEAVYNRIFNGDPGSFIREISYGKLWLNGNVNPTNGETNYRDVYGWYQIEGELYPSLFEHDSSMSEFEFERTTKPLFETLFNKISEEDNNLDLASYDGFVFIHPRGRAAFAWGGKSIFETEKFGDIFTSIGSVRYNNVKTGSWMDDFGIFDTLLTHEFGHLLGLGHADAWECGENIMGDNCEEFNKGNFFDTMGRKKLRHYNAYFKELLGWLNVEDGSVLAITQPGEYILRPIESSDAVVGKIVGSNSKIYYLEYRKPEGFDSSIGQVDTIFKTYTTENENLGGIYVNWPHDRLYTRLLDIQPNNHDCVDNWNCHDWESVALLPGESFSDGEVEITNIIEIEDTISFSVDFGDEERTHRSYLTTTESLGGGCECSDVNDDGVVDIKDLVFVSQHFGEENSKYNLETSNNIVDEGDLGCVVGGFGSDANNIDQCVNINQGVIIQGASNN
tara:strand:- start:2310 stop:4958 length:2649 start_codon:yes stop_codon:yes gene_type:complete